MIELLGQALPWAGVLGFALIMRGRRSKPTPKDPNEPVCGCNHQLAMHAPETNLCHALIDGQAIKYDDWKHPTAYEKVQCPCRQYVGPKPIDLVFQPRLQLPLAEQQ